MRHSFIALVGTVLVGIVACSDEPSSLDGGTAGRAGKASGRGGAAGKSTGSSGKGNAGRGGTGAKGVTGGTGSSGEGGDGSGGTGAAGSGGTSKGGKGSGGSGNAGAGAMTNGGEGGIDTGTGGTGNAGTGGTGGTGLVGASGANDSGAGGESAGAGGEGGATDNPCGKAGVLCETLCVDPSERTLDQSMVDQDGYIIINAEQLPGQSFTVGASGRLIGIEVPIGSCNDASTSGTLRLELFDSDDNSLGHVKIPQTVLPNNCGYYDLDVGSIGASYFDLTPLCVSATSGDSFTFILSLADVAPATCDTGGTYQCSDGSGGSCYSDADCGPDYGAGFTNCGGYGCVGAPSDYTGGVSYMQDPDTGELTPSPSFEMAFKTFMQ